MIKDLVKTAHRTAKSKGFYDHNPTLLEILCKIHTEVSEAVDADIKNRYALLPALKEIKGIESKNEIESFNEWFEINHKNTFEDELADIVIRVFDLAGHKNIDLEGHILMKMEYNKHRPYKHGKKY